MSRKEDKSTKCIGCGGWPVENGAIFTAVRYVDDESVKDGHICELCLLQRLQRRGAIVNGTSGPMYQIDLPEIGINRRPEPRKRPPLSPPSRRPLRRLGDPSPSNLPRKLR